MPGTLVFPQKSPPARDLKLWECAIIGAAPRRCPEHQLGGYVAKGHKIWGWRYDLEKECLYHLQGAVMDIYTPSVIPGYTLCPNRWTRSCLDQPRLENVNGQICTVQGVALGEKVKISSVEGSPPIPPPMTFWEVMQKWQHMWMWNNVQWVGDDDWIAIAIVD
jgi:hypothetical protein